ncbi:MAG: cupin domain-containing protein [Actinobacteria bacterium]|nr:cupin domain-containing protein [Actinomycetota bacterium]
MDRQDLIDRLGLSPHPEGGWYRETWRDEPADGGRGVGSAIYFLLGEGERSHWHRVDAAEVWHHYAGDPLELAIADGDHHVVVRLGPDLDAGQEPQALVPARAWQAARTTGAWTLVGATVSPAFEFAGFDLAAPDWTPDAWSTPGW